MSENKKWFVILEKKTFVLELDILNKNSVLEIIGRIKFNLIVQPLEVAEWEALLFLVPTFK